MKFTNQLKLNIDDVVRIEKFFQVRAHWYTNQMQALTFFLTPPGITYNHIFESELLGEDYVDTRYSLRQKPNTKYQL